MTTATNNAPVTMLWPKLQDLAMKEGHDWWLHTLLRLPEHDAMMRDAVTARWTISAIGHDYLLANVEVTVQNEHGDLTTYETRSELRQGKTTPRPLFPRLRTKVVMQRLNRDASGPWWAGLHEELVEAEQAEAQP